MDSFFGVGLPELILILLLAGIIMGPQRIRRVAYTLGRVTAQLQTISRQFARQLNAELDGLDDETVRGAMSDMRELQREVEILRRELSQVPKSLRDGIDSGINEAQEAVQTATASVSDDEEDVSNPLPSNSSDPAVTKPNQSDPPQAELDSPQKSKLPKAIDVPEDPE